MIISHKTKFSETFLSLLLKKTKFVSSLPDDRTDAASAPGGIRKRARRARDHGTFWFCGSPPVRTKKDTKVRWKCPGFLVILLKIAQQLRRDTKARFRILIHFLRSRIQRFKVSVELNQNKKMLVPFLHFNKLCILSKFCVSIYHEQGWKVTFQRFFDYFSSKLKPICKPRSGSVFKDTV